MSNESEIHNEARELLPWYINGTLESDQEAMVREHLNACNECRDDYEFLGNVDVAVNNSSPAPIVPQPPIESFLARIDAAEKAPKGRDYRALWAVAASLVVAILVAVSFLDERTPVTDIPSRFETATSASNSVSMDYVLHIRFENSTAMDQHARIIESFGGRNAVAERDGYRMVVSVPATSLQEAEEFTASIEARPEVKSVEIVALQLPVRNE
ncbi:MAG: zf-HC2 domain-containing protein [Woeseiaceae bacterium]